MPKKPKQDTLSKQQMATEFGYDLAFFKSDPELYGLLNQAIAHNWDEARFAAEFQNSKWFASHSDAERNYIDLKTTDPGAFRNRLNQARASVRDMAVQLGAQMTDKHLTKVANDVLRFGWNDAQIRDTLAGSVNPGAGGTYGGNAATNVADMRKTAMSNGVKIADGTLRDWAVRMAAGEDPSGFEQYIRQTAATAFPTYAEQIKGGMDMDQIADPYRQQMAQTLEIDPNTIDLFDPTLRKALQAQTGDGQIAAKPMWQFESELKHDDRYDKTTTARTDAAKFAATFAQEFGAI